ncbi:unnamed protein product [Tuber melanosporum]|uniref:(Perigord truffle) hypothetical protein n=1 Tax=Tuber melanosporum (strain Mel28) TaxID=656061 RepID=D5GKH3_TUBMM|nr:uncharacterized protein GSTUM_00009559001 [Tuber melanosporum]CAZ85016.1 unnamed protein product [Tuber melanosporum]
MTYVHPRKAALGDSRLDRPSVPTENPGTDFTPPPRPTECHRGCRTRVNPALFFRWCCFRTPHQNSSCENK